MEVEGHGVEPGAGGEQPGMEYAAESAAQYAAGSVAMDHGAQQVQEAVQGVGGGEAHEGATYHFVEAQHVAAPLAEVTMEGKATSGNELLELEREVEGEVEGEPQHEAEATVPVQAPPATSSGPDGMPEAVQVSDPGVAQAPAAEAVPDVGAVQEPAPAQTLEVSLPRCPMPDLKCGARGRAFEPDCWEAARASAPGRTLRVPRGRLLCKLSTFCSHFARFDTCVPVAGCHCCAVAHAGAHARGRPGGSFIVRKGFRACCPARFCCRGRLTG